MKKTLAAVLAAAMALSTATVALAKDTLEGETILENISTVGGRTEIAKGKSYSYILSADVLEGTDISATDLGTWVKDGDVTVTVTVTEGMSKLASKPTAVVKNIYTYDDVETIYKWTGFSYDVTVDGKVVAKPGTEVTSIPVKKSGDNWVLALVPDEVERVLYPRDTAWKTVLGDMIEANVFVEGAQGEVIQGTKPAVQVSFKVDDDWGTGSDNIGMKFRITFKKAVGGYSKGDTVMTDAVLFEATYHKMNDKGTEMELTRPECGTNDFREVLMNKDGELYDKIGNDEFTVYFENAAAFTGKMAANQKTLNMYYTLAEDSDLVNAYPDVDFEFIEFKGKPSFVNTGKMTFSAVGGSTTQVYEWDGEAWEPLNGTYNKTYNTVEVKGIKRLGKYAIASDILPVEEEPEEPDEPAEPVSSAPTTEPDDEGQNPNTGAC